MVLQMCRFQKFYMAALELGLLGLGRRGRARGGAGAGRRRGGPGGGAIGAAHHTGDDLLKQGSDAAHADLEDDGAL